jgi:hypothetical protein
MEFRRQVKRVTMSDTQPPEVSDLVYLAAHGAFSKRKALMRAAAQKDLKSMEILCRTFSFTHDDVCEHKSGKSVLYAALSSENLETVKFLFNTFIITKEDVEREGGFYYHTPAFMTFILDRYEFYFWELSDIFTVAVKCNNVWLVQYLCSHNFDEAQPPNYDKALRRAASRGHVNMLCCLKEMRGVGESDVSIRAHHNAALRKATMKGHLDVIKCLHTEFGLTFEDLVDGTWGAPAAVFETHGRMDMLQYFFNDMSLGQHPDRVKPAGIVANWPWPEEESSVRGFLMSQGCKFESMF